MGSLSSVQIHSIRFSAFFENRDTGRRRPVRDGRAGYPALFRTLSGALWLQKLQGPRWLCILKVDG